MAYLNTKRGLSFRMEFICMEFLMGDGKPRRGAIIGYGEMTPRKDPNHINAVVLFEGGACVPKVIRRADFIKAQRDNSHVTLIEAPNTDGVTALVGPGGEAISRG